jgi:uroporphyrinogen decarboxylase
MESREIVDRAIHYRHPPRLSALLSNEIGDIGFLQFKPPVSFTPSRNGMDEWGCVWSRGDWTCGQVVAHPLNALRDLDRLCVPDYADDSRYQGAEATVRDFEARGMYVECPYADGVLVHMARLYGFENCMAGFYEDGPGIEALADKVADVCVQFVREVARRFSGRVHGWMIIDDCATQYAGFVSPEFWMEFLYPRYRRIFDAIHAAGGNAAWHSCGNVTELIEGFVAAGADLIDMGQPRATDLSQIARRYGDRVAFRSGIDAQTTLTGGDRREVDADVEHMMTLLASPAGGFVSTISSGGSDAAMKDRTVIHYAHARFSAWSERVYGQPLPTLERCPVCRRQIDACWCPTLDRMQYLRDWHIVGPFRSPERGRVNLEMPAPVDDAFATLGSGQVDLRAQYQTADGTRAWQPVRAPEYGVVQLGPHLGVVEWALAYGYAEIAWPRDEEFTVGIGSDDGVKLWINGEVVFAEEAQRSCQGVASMTQVHLRKGTNRILVKIDNYILGWGFVLGFAQSDPVPH